MAEEEGGGRKRGEQRGEEGMGEGEQTLRAAEGGRKKSSLSVVRSCPRAAAETSITIITARCPQSKYPLDNVETPLLNLSNHAIANKFYIICLLFLYQKYFLHYI